MVVGDDGTCNAGAVVSIPARLEPFSGPQAPLFADSSLLAGVKALACRTLKTIVREIFKTRKLRREVRSWPGTGALPGASNTLMPEAVEKSRRVRLFMKRRPGEMVWREQTGWMILRSLDSVDDDFALFG